MDEFTKAKSQLRNAIWHGLFDVPPDQFEAVMDDIEASERMEQLDEIRTRVKAMEEARAAAVYMRCVPSEECNEARGHFE